MQGVEADALADLPDLAPESAAAYKEFCLYVACFCTNLLNSALQEGRKNTKDAANSFGVVAEARRSAKCDLSARSPEHCAG